MPQRAAGDWIESRAIINRGRHTKLIVRPVGADEGPWEFPGGRLMPHESPEGGLRRLCRAALGVELEIAIGQPPFVHHFGSHSVTYRYYLCSIPRGEPLPLACAEIRWVATPQLRDYVFDAPTQHVVDWLLDEKPDA